MGIGSGMIYMIVSESGGNGLYPHEGGDIYGRLPFCPVHQHDPSSWLICADIHNNYIEHKRTWVPSGAISSHALLLAPLLQSSAKPATAE